VLGAIGFKDYLGGVFSADNFLLLPPAGSHSLLLFGLKENGGSSGYRRRDTKNSSCQNYIIKKFWQQTCSMGNFDLELFQPAALFKQKYPGYCIEFYFDICHYYCYYLFPVLC
jgi:hypothetical protein